MIEKFNGIFYLIVFLVHFVIFAAYAYQTVFATKKFLDKFGIDDTGAGMTRFFGSLFIGAVAMAIWVGFIRPDGLQGTWAFFNLVFLQNLSAFCVGIYTIKINKLGHTPQTSNEGIIAPGRNFLLNILVAYLSLLSQRIVTIVLPGPNSLPILIAPAILIPQLVPKLRPSF